MSLLNFMRKPQNELEAEGRASAPVHADEGEPQVTCPNCRRSIPESRLWADYGVCGCGHHFRMNARQRIRFIADRGTFRERDAGLEGRDFLDFPGYDAKLELSRTRTGETEAVICGTARIGGRPCCLFVMNADFMMGSMGSAVGEKITRLFEYAADHAMSVVGFTVSGGARMQEGLISLMQMAKTSGAVQRHSAAGLFYLTVLTDPTTGGVTASFAMEGDVILAEPGATVGFAGARVIEQTTKKALPKGFQKSESLLEHGFIDAIVPRAQQKDTIARLLTLYETDSRRRAAGLPRQNNGSHPRLLSAGAITSPDRRAAYEVVVGARSAKRPTGLDYIYGSFTGFMELHGDRAFGDDPAIVAGVAWLDHLPVTVIAIEKGHTAKERQARSFGMPQPEGYRKALRLMKQAEKFHRPVICFVDTSGAYCGIGAEERGQGQAIAENLMAMMALDTPIISLLVGEGGSGGALALAVADRVWMLENAAYSVISPEGCASILWKDAAKAAEAAQSLKLTAQDAYAFGLIEACLSEEGLGTEEFYASLRELLAAELTDLLQTPDRTQQRWQRFRRIGTP